MKTKLKKAELLGQFAGADGDPAKMGTTGLVAWVLAGQGQGLNRWDRWQAAARVVRKRGLCVERFAKAVLATGTANGINLDRFARATGAALEARP